MVYMGIYSSRPWTFADKNYPDNLPYPTKYTRRKQMNELLKQISKTNNQKEIWTTTTMLVNKIEKNWTINGYTNNMKQIVVTPSHKKINDSPHPQLWDIIPIRIIGAEEFRLKGEI
jgi:tRNA-2-methylthio-N6-dimethylallyladenosine synthase